MPDRGIRALTGLLALTIAAGPALASNGCVPSPRITRSLLGSLGGFSAIRLAGRDVAVFGSRVDDPNMPQGELGMDGYAFVRRGGHWRAYLIDADYTKERAYAAPDGGYVDLTALDRGGPFAQVSLFFVPARGWPHCSAINTMGSSGAAPDFLYSLDQLRFNMTRSGAATIIIRKDDEHAIQYYRYTNAQAGQGDWQGPHRLPAADKPSGIYVEGSGRSAPVKPLLAELRRLAR